MTGATNTLYILPKSLYSNVGVLLLWEKGVQDKYTLTAVDLEGNEHNRPDFVRLNPAGKVPVLVHDGQVIPDSLSIAQFLDQDGSLRAHDPEVVSFVEEWRQISVKALVLAEQPVDEKALAAHAEKIAADRAEMVAYQQQHPDLDYALRLSLFDLRAQWLLDPVVFHRHQQSWYAVLDHCETVLSSGSPYLVGNTHSLADVFATAFIWSGNRHLAHPETIFAGRPHLQQYYDRQSKRPAVIHALFE
ncbi:uncharacterized protein BX664DRAFT_337175 [Halteromyces radiatus]|uniref:uncharacterized protein n=1 Tax=Halteromyces radiatus TaxID=101107 RepID=UPI00221F3A1C|nr:uncharacterized protein BX664DRAFT_337175 [Halteromyces radiatus]KAI8084519.1 hypothetical protein BX664DRAFT_337175 [Halteromyces radiatus]